MTELVSALWWWGGEGNNNERPVVSVSERMSLQRRSKAEFIHSFIDAKFVAVFVHTTAAASGAFPPQRARSSAAAAAEERGKITWKLRDDDDAGKHDKYINDIQLFLQRMGRRRRR